MSDINFVQNKNYFLYHWYDYQIHIYTGLNQQDNSDLLRKTLSLCETESWGWTFRMCLKITCLIFEIMNIFSHIFSSCVEKSFPRKICISYWENRILSSGTFFIEPPGIYSIDISVFLLKVCPVYITTDSNKVVGTLSFYLKKLELSN